MAAPLQYLHAQHPPVIHRDFKPDNILAVSKSNGRIQWKIADFGVARMLSENAYGEYYAQTDIGTPIYMAPEALAVRTWCIVCMVHEYFMYPSHDIAIWSFRMAE